MKKMNALSTSLLAAAVLAGGITAPASANNTETLLGSQSAPSALDIQRSAAVSVNSAKSLITSANTALEKIDLTEKADEVNVAKQVREAESDRKNNQAKVTSETVTLKAPKSIEKETDTLLVGESKVESKAVSGTALKTTTVTIDKNGNIATSEKFNITKAPKAEVVLIGTREPVIIPEVPENIVNNTDNETSTTLDIVEPESTSVIADNSDLAIENPDELPVDEDNVVDVESETNDEDVSVSRASQTAVDNNDGDTSSSETGIVNRPGASSAETWIPSSQYKVEAEKLAKGTDDKLLKLALEQTGKPYVWGATGPSAFDCSGLVYYVYALNGKMSIPRTAYAQGLASTPVSRDDIQPGDILWSKTHVGIYIGDNKMVHAANPSKGVAIDDINYYLNNGMKIGRL